MAWVTGPTNATLTSGLRQPRSRLSRPRKHWHSPFAERTPGLAPRLWKAWSAWEGRHSAAQRC